jgi:cellulose synthase operon protein C
MNLVPTSILLRALALISVFSFAAFASKSKEYENFDLPQAATSTAPESVSLPFSSLEQRVLVKKGTARFGQPGFNAQEYIFAKEAFLAEKRDEAIKLLRQELDSGFKRNRDNMLLRLGQLYAEKYMELSFHENELFTKNLAEYEKEKTLKKGLTPPKLDNSRSQSYLKDALQLFTSLEKEYPKHPRIDEIVFFIGFVNMEIGNPQKGTRYLERVVHEFPRSRKFEEAVVYLGDVYFDKTKFRDALVKYRILSTRKESSLYDYAMYKIAWCELNTSEAMRGLKDLKALVNRLEGNKELAKFNLREQALKDLVVFYGEVGQVDEAIAFFTEKVGRDRAIENLRLIADILRSKARDEAAARAYALLLKEFPDAPDAPKLALGLNDSLSRIGKGGETVKNLVNAMQMYHPGSDWANKIPPEKMKDANDSMDQLANDAAKNAFFFHNSAQKSSNKASYEYALQIYQALLDYYPNFPDRKKVAYYRGEILYAQGKWLQASESYMIAARLLPKDKVADESTYDALLALDRLTAKNDNLERYSKDDQKKVDLTPQTIPSNELKFIDVANYYLKEYPQGQRIVDVKFRIAAIYYKYHHFDEAQAMFKDIALKTPKHRSAVTAANLVLDIYNLKKDYVNLDATAQMFAKVDGLGDAAFRADMAQISTEIDFKKVETLESASKWDDAGQTYYTLYLNHPNSSLAEKSLYNAFVSFDKAGNAAKASEVSRLFVTKFPKSEYTKRFTLSLAKFAEKQYDFEQAQKLYFEFHQKFPTDREAKKALYNSAVFAELTEKNTTALSLYEQYIKEVKPTGDELKTIRISEAKLYRKEHNWDKMAAIYRRLMRESKSMDERVSLLGELAHNYEVGGKMTERDQLMKEIRYFYEQNPKMSTTGPAFEYVAESKFHSVEPQREKYEKIVLKFPAEDLLYLLHRKQKALAKLDTAYDAVVQVGVPDWGVAALYEKSAAFQNFADAFHKIEIPARYKGDERKEIESQLKSIETQLVKPVEAKVQVILKSCTDKAAQFFVANEYAAKCRERMKADDKSTPDPTGIFPQPSYWTTRYTGGGGVAKK